MSPNATLVVETLRNYRKLSAPQLGAVLTMPLCEVYRALVQLSDAGLAYCNPDKRPVPGVGWARYWRAS